MDYLTVLYVRRLDRSHGAKIRELVGLHFFLEALAKTVSSTSRASRGRLHSLAFGPILRLSKPAAVDQVLGSHLSDSSSALFHFSNWAHADNLG